ncbi:MAG: 5-formyltetrahydrofolate cyclo-ligase [Acidobacteriota bacterium]
MRGAGPFATKDAARRAVWDALEREGAARFPFPPHGRIPNFAGAGAAARRLLDGPAFASARLIKVNPDAPQRPLRLEALRRGMVLFVPAPRLRGGFRRLDPSAIPRDRLAEAASLSRGGRWSVEVPLSELPRMDLIVTGSVAVTRAGGRCGKGHGYGDIEYAILRELGHGPAPVATTVHRLQIVEGLPRERHDLPVTWIATPEELIRVEDPPPPPRGVDWEALPAAALKEMPVLAELRRMRAARAR